MFGCKTHIEGAGITVRRFAMFHGALLAGAMTVWSAPALAQSAAPETLPEDAAADETERSGVIMVTARRREENLIEVPISITTFSADRLENLTANSLADIGNFVPNLFYTDRSTLQTDITIRGIGGDARNIGIESGVGLYVDGVYAGRTAAYNMDLADIAQIEVLRGPQGTTFGKNTTGGAINITTKRPTQDFEAQAVASYGNYDAVRFVGSVSGGLTEGVSAKVRVATLDRDGYLFNQFDGRRLQDEKRRAVLGQLRFEPSPDWDILLSVDYTEDDRNVVQNQLGSPAAFGAGFFNRNRFIVNTDQPNTATREMLGVSLIAKYEFPDGGPILTSITGYRDTEITVFSDIDQTPNRVFDSGPFTDNSTMYSQELQLASSGTSTIEYLVGLYLYRQDAEASRAIRSRGNPLFNTSGPVDTISYAGFANLTWNVSDAFSLTGGFRLTYEKKEGSYRQGSPNPSFNKNFPNLEISVTEPAWNLAANYMVGENASIYATVSRGFKSGGFNVDPLATPVPLTEAEITFQPEFVTSYEAGWKAGLLNGRLQLGAAVFYSDFSNRQVPQFETVGGVPTVIVRNAGTSEVWGFELEATARVSSQFSVYGGLGYLDGEYTSFPRATSGGANFTGNTTERTPDLTINLGAEVNVPLSPSTNFVFSPQFAYVGETFLQADNLPFNVEDGYAIVNMRAGVAFDNDRFGLYFWGKNLTDTEYKVFARQFAGSDQVLFGEPRTYGVELRMNF